MLSFIRRKSKIDEPAAEHEFRCCLGINIVITEYITDYNFVVLSGILNKDGSLNNTESIKRLAEVSVAYAKAGMKTESYICYPET